MSLAKVASEFRSRGWTEFPSDSQQQALVREAARTCCALFGLPGATKRACESPENDYRSGFRQPRSASKPSEVWQVSRNDPPHTWPPELRGAKENLIALIDVVVALVGDLFTEFGVPDYGVSGALRHSITSDSSVLRLLSYRGEDRDVGFPAHTDFGLASVFLWESEPGLQLQEGGAQWKFARPAPERWIIATGEMLSALTGGEIHAQQHRVVSRDQDRFAIAMFIHPSRDFSLNDSNGQAVSAEAWFERQMARTIGKGD